MNGVASFLGASFTWIESSFRENICTTYRALMESMHICLCFSPNKVWKVTTTSVIFLL